MQKEEKIIRDFFNVEEDIDAMILFMKSASESLTKSFKDDGIEIVKLMLKDLLVFPDYTYGTGEVDAYGEIDYNTLSVSEEDIDTFCQEYAEKIMNGKVNNLQQIEKAAESLSEECYKIMSDIYGDEMGRASI